MLVIHDDGDTLDVLTRAFEATGCDVVTAVAGFRAQAHLEGERPIDVVVAPWDTTRVVGGEVYRWALQKRYELRDQFVFIGGDTPPDFDQIVAGRCLLVPDTSTSEIVDVALATVGRREQLAAQRKSRPKIEGARHRLLVIDDEPILLSAMTDVLIATGYAVVSCESGNSAIAMLEHASFDAIVVDWHMDDGSGADVYRWLERHRPELAERVVFLSDGETDDAAEVAPDRPMIRKGQDSHALAAILRDIVRERTQDLG